MDEAIVEGTLHLPEMFTPKEGEWDLPSKLNFWSLIYKNSLLTYYRFEQGICGRRKLQLRSWARL